MIWQIDWYEIATQFVITLAHSLWQGLVIASVLLLALRLVPGKQSNTRYLIAMTALILLPLSAIATYVVVSPDQANAVAGNLPANLPASVAPSIASTLGTEPLTIDSASPASFAADPDDRDFPSQIALPAVKLESVLTILAPGVLLLYALGVGTMSARLMRSIYRSSRLRYQTVPCDSSIQSLVRRQSKRLGLRRVPGARWCQHVGVPVVVGILKPMILLPPAVLSGLDADQLSAVISHELAHVRRYDLLGNLVQRIVEVLLFFHPATWWISRHVSAERENCCDDIAVARFGPHRYADALLAMAGLIATGQDPKVSAQLNGLAADGHSPSQLSVRIRRILGEPTPSRLAVSRPSIVLAGLLFASSAAVAIVTAQTTSPKDKPGDRTTVQASAQETAEEKSPASPTTKSVAKSTEHTLATEAETPAEESTLRYPYCVVDVDDLADRLLSDAITEFNLQARQSPVGYRQTPITADETIAAIRAYTAEDHVPAASRETMLAIANSNTMPATAYFRRFTRYDDGKSMRRIWWVRLVVTTDTGPVYCVPVRTTELSSRPFTQLERQQRAANGITLLNRHSSYFSSEPNILLLAEFPQAAQQRLIADTRAAIAGDVSALNRVFEWNGASKALREFATNELTQLTDEKIEDIKVTPRNFRADMVHWSGYQAYEPNLPVAGYLDISYQTTGANAKRRTLSLEIARVGDNLKLVSYIAKGKRELPKGVISGLSTTGHVEPLPGNRYLTTTLTTNPETLISAHIGNEEVWEMLQGK